MRGIELAKEMQMAIVRVGTGLIERKEVKMHNDFRYTIVDDSYLKDIQLFQYPLALQKLGLFVMAAHKVSPSPPSDGCVEQARGPEEKTQSAFRD